MLSKIASSQIQDSKIWYEIQILLNYFSLEKENILFKPQLLLFVN